MAGASEAGIEQSPVCDTVRPAIAGGRMGTPSRSRGTAVALQVRAQEPFLRRELAEFGHLPTQEVRE